MRQKIVAGNWKMNLSPTEAHDLVAGVGAYLSGLINTPALPPNHKQHTVLFCPPSIYLAQVVQQVTALNLPNLLGVGAQNCHWATSGAYTGEVAAQQIAQTGAGYVIIGHSERRQYNHETHDILAQKTLAALTANLKVIFCCGEPLEVRNANEQFEWVGTQLTQSLFDLPQTAMQQIVIAYEPIWAIGTGQTATPQQAGEMHTYIRQHLTNQYGQATANQIPVLYGGSCNAQNAASLFAQPNVDGGLIGGASLKVPDFCAIAQALLTSDI